MRRLQRLEEQFAPADRPRRMRTGKLPIDKIEVGFRYRKVITATTRELAIRGGASGPHPNTAAGRIVTSRDGKRFGEWACLACSGTATTAFSRRHLLSGFHT